MMSNPNAEMHLSFVMKLLCSSTTLFGLLVVSHHLLEQDTEQKKKINLFVK